MARSKPLEPGRFDATHGTCTIRKRYGPWGRYALLVGLRPEASSVNLAESTHRPDPAVLANEAVRRTIRSRGLVFGHQPGEVHSLHETHKPSRPRETIRFDGTCETIGFDAWDPSISPRSVPRDGLLSP